jgi:predicted porin
MGEFEMMKKTTSALAVAALLGTGAASAATFQVNDDTSLTLSGKVYPAYKDVKDGTGDSKSTHTDYSRVIIAGSHALDNGLTAFANYELRPQNGISNNGKAGGSSDEIETRRANLGVSGDFGSVKFGREYTIHDRLIDGFSGYQDTLGPSKVSDVSAAKRVLNYASPSINGFQFEVEAQLEDDANKADTNDNNSGFAAGVVYDAGVAQFHAAYNDGNMVDGNADEDPIIGLAAAFAVNTVDVSAVYQKDEAAANDTDLMALNLGTSVDAIGLQLTLQDVDVDGSDSRTEVIGRAAYNFSDNFYVSAEYRVQDKAEDEGDGYALNAAYTF